MKILLLEDEVMLRGSIMEFLESQNHRVVECEDGLGAKELILKEEFDLFLLDINVPSMSGFELLEEVKELRINTPVIFISALVDIEDITKGFTLGCIDYIKKPFHLQELALRIENITRYMQNKELNHVILSRNYSFDARKRTLYFDQEPQMMTKRQIEIIELLSKNLGLVVDFEKFREYVWGNELIDNATIRAEINRLKKSLKEDFIKNIRGLGYKIEKVC